MRLDLKKVSMYLADKVGCGYYRLVSPGMLLEERASFNVKQMDFFSEYAFHWSDICVFQRCYSDKLLKTFKDLQNKGKVVVYELDDDIFNVSKNSPAYATFHKSNHLDSAKSLISAANLVTCSTESLKNVLLNYNNNVEVLPNSLDFRLWPRPQKEKVSFKNEVRLGWFGSPTHFEDLQFIIPVLERLLESNLPLKIIFFGYIPLNFKRFSGKVEFVEGVAFPEFRKVLTNLGIDIGLAPVKDTAFNHSKSNLKYLEFSAVRAVTVASNCLPYNDTVIHGVNGYLADNNNPDEWVKIITDLVNDETKRKEISNNAYNLVFSNFNIYKNYKLWEDAYKRNLNVV
ncbi:MAG: glycosyltransferase [Candidatus Paceibacterota bacterium]|jgi:glycosyltransferase involved in cell wall biosynthesis